MKLQKQKPKIRKPKIAEKRYVRLTMSPSKESMLLEKGLNLQPLLAKNQYTCIRKINM